MNQIPILKLNKNLIASIQIELTDEEAITFQQSLLEKNSHYQTLGVIIDVSLLEIIDSFMAKVLSEITQTVKIQGSEVVICGIQPHVAITLQEMGMNLAVSDTFLSLERAYNYLTNKQGHL